MHLLQYKTGHMAVVNPPKHGVAIENLTHLSTPTEIEFIVGMRRTRRRPRLCQVNNNRADYMARHCLDSTSMMIEKTRDGCATEKARQADEHPQ